MENDLSSKQLLPWLNKQIKIQQQIMKNTKDVKDEEKVFRRACTVRVVLDEFRHMIILQSRMNRVEL